VTAARLFQESEQTTATRWLLRSLVGGGGALASATISELGRRGFSSPKERIS
jgi:hypothetical protein